MKANPINALRALLALLKGRARSLSRNRYAKPVPEAFQRQARLRRVRQQFLRCEISADAYDRAIIDIESDYAKREAA